MVFLYLYYCCCINIFHNFVLERQQYTFAPMKMDQSSQIYRVQIKLYIYFFFLTFPSDPSHKFSETFHHEPSSPTSPLPHKLSSYSYKLNRRLGILQRSLLSSIGSWFSLEVSKILSIRQQCRLTDTLWGNLGMEERSHLSDEW